MHRQKLKCNPYVRLFKILRIGEDTTVAQILKNSAQVPTILIHSLACFVEITQPCLALNFFLPHNEF